ncbi:hypothetical protein BJ170DRAFT_360903 [Xylariales sp. AK1849]|nr:hypothetical protein BJ170DRAFT_360903 [Xylariales sp. AK1849]
MSTPQSTAGANEGEPRNLEQITFRFCSECSNMLYPKEDEDSHKLQFTCRTCQYTEEATSTCVFRNVMNNAVGETAGVTQDVGSDPTVRTNVSSVAAVPAASRATPASDTSGEFNSIDSLTYQTVLMSAGLAICLECGRAASIGGFNHLTTPDGRSEFESSIRAITVASVYKCLDPKEQAAWDTEFVSRICSGLSGEDQEDLTHYLGYGIASNPEADPPEALGVEPEDEDLEHLL